MYRSGLAQKFEHRSDQAFRLDVHPGETIDLPDQDRKRDADEESRQDGTRQEGRKNAEPKHPRRQAKQSDAKREDCSDRSAVHCEPGWHARRNGDQSRRKHRHRCRVRTDYELTRGAKERVGDQRRDAGVNAGLRRQPRYRRIGDGTGKPNRGNCEPGGDIASHPARLIA